MPRPVALWLTVLCLLTAAALRLPDLATSPPGPHYDEAANGILAAEIGWQGYRPVFITSYTGKEVLFFYLAGVMSRVAGPGLFSLRLTAALLGLLTVAVTVGLARALCRDRRLAVLAAILLTTSLWHLILSRLGFRAISQPLLQGLTVLLLWQGLRRERPGWLLAAGAALGLTGYTYLAARLFPLLLLLAAGPLLLGAQWQRRGRQLLLVGATALLVLAPLLLFFLRQPDAFWVRISQIGPDTDAGLAVNYGRALGMLFWQGDPYWRFNLPGRPLFDWFWGGLLLAGWIFQLFLMRRANHDWERAAALLLWLTPLVMVLPTALAAGDIIPSNLRAVGLMPFVFLLPAQGLVALWDSLQPAQGLAALRPSLPQAPALRRQATPPRRPGGAGRRVTAHRLFPGLLLLVTLGGGAVAGWLYFRQWAPRSDVFYDSDADLAAVARYLDTLPAGSPTLFVAARHYRHPTLALLSRRYEEINWLPQSEALVIPAAGRARYVYPRNSPAPEWIGRYVTPEAVVDGPAGPDGQPAFTSFELDASINLEPATGQEARFGNLITLLGYEWGAASAGGTLPVTLFWAVQRRPEANFMPFVHLEDAWGHRWSQVESFAYPAEQWRPGDRIIQRVDLPIPPGTPPNYYRLHIGLFNPEGGQRLARLDEAGRFAGTTLLVPEVAVTAGPVPPRLPEPPVKLDVVLSSGLQLIGYEPPPGQASTGEIVDLALWWLARRPAPDLITRLELIRPDRTGFILADTAPVHGTYPISSWPAPSFLIDRLSARIPPDLAPGAYQLQARFLNANDETVKTVPLGGLTVAATARQFAPPRLRFPLAATLGGEIELLGYNLDRADRPGQYDLTLVWRAQVEPAADYTVFVHLLDPNGVCCLWQEDLMPRQASYPTTRWVPGEVVVDEYRLALPAGTPAGSYPLEVGLYLAESGHRLAVQVPGLRVSDALMLQPVHLEQAVP